MSPTLKNSLGLVLGVILGGLANMAIIQLSDFFISPPAGVDPSDIESIKANIHLYKVKHFIFPFLAHALGTLVGALVALKIASKHHFTFALAIAGFFFLGGLSMVFMLPTPTWFIITDLGLAYFPMGLLAYKLTRK